MSVDVELASVDVQQRFLLGYQSVAPRDFLESRWSHERPGRGRPQCGPPINTASRDNFSVDAEHAPIDIQQSLLFGNQFIAELDVLSRRLVPGNCLRVGTCSGKNRYEQAHNSHCGCSAKTLGQWHSCSPCHLRGVDPLSLILLIAGRFIGHQGLRESNRTGRPLL